MSSNPFPGLAMRSSELMGIPVVDATGDALGPVRDLRVAWEEEAAPPPAVSSRFEVAGLVIGGGRFARLAHACGYTEGRATGPWVLRKLFEPAIRDARFVPAEAVGSWGPRTVELTCAASDLRPLRERER